MVSFILSSLVIIPLSIVHNEWQSECGPSHLQRAGEHYNLFSDVYNRVFQPLGFMDVKYGDIKIRRGNIVYPKQVCTVYGNCLDVILVIFNGHFSLLKDHAFPFGRFALNN